MGSILDDFAGSYAGEFIQMSWKDDGMKRAFDSAPDTLKKRINAILQRYAPEIEGHMKINAIWEDQTSNARNGLAARAFDDPTGTGIVLFHQVPYGIWLEVRWSGKYGIIMPTIEEYGPKVMGSIEGLLGGPLT